MAIMFALGIKKFSWLPNRAFSPSQNIKIGYIKSMSNVEEIEAAIPKLSIQELARLRTWFDEYCEDRLELNDSVKAKLDQAREEIRTGDYRTREPQ